MVLELFKDDVPQKEIRRGILSRLATLNRNEAEQVFTHLDDTPRAARESRSCRYVVLVSSRARVHRSPLSRSIPDDDDLYQQGIIDENEDYSNTEVTIDCQTPPPPYESLGEIEEAETMEEKQPSNNHRIHTVIITDGIVWHNTALLSRRKMKRNLERDAVVLWRCRQCSPQMCIQEKDASSRITLAIILLREQKVRSA